MNIIMAILFFQALFGVFYFLGKLLTWVAWKINPETFKIGITPRDIFIYSIVGIYSCILWSILFYYVISK